MERNQKPPATAAGSPVENPAAVLVSGTEKPKASDPAPTTPTNQDPWDMFWRENRYELEIKWDLSNYSRFPFGSKAFPVQRGNCPGVEIKDKNLESILLVPIQNQITFLNYFQLFYLFIALLFMWIFDYIPFLLIWPLGLALSTGFFWPDLVLPLRWITARENAILDFSLKRQHKKDGIWHTVLHEKKSVGFVVLVPHANGTGVTWKILDPTSQKIFECSCPIDLADDLRGMPKLFPRDPIRIALTRQESGSTAGYLTSRQPWMEPFTLDLSNDPQHSLDRRLALVFAVLCISPRKDQPILPDFVNSLFPFLNMAQFRPIAKRIWCWVGIRKHEPLKAPWEK